MYCLIGEHNYSKVVENKLEYGSAEMQEQVIINVFFCLENIKT